jgi:hypothetical protein
MKLMKEQHVYQGKTVIENTKVVVVMLSRTICGECRDRQGSLFSKGVEGFDVYHRTKTAIA